ncbi:MAG TPA: hypothetical protein DD396_01440 [Bacteroidetes bacterium]|jgi:hypothetical protein|nr:hypothetical protein [Bacteroidota bacterium]
MGCNFLILSIFILGLRWSSCAQDIPQQWAILTSYEANYTGTNAIIHGLYIKNHHQLEAGLNYNFSDGFSNNPVIGIGLAYGFEILTNDKWSITSGINYRRQKPLAIVNIQILTYTQGLAYKLNPKLAITSRLGYGVAVERAASAGNFSQNNNITGSFTLGCVFFL